MNKMFTEDDLKVIKIKKFYLGDNIIYFKECMLLNPYIIDDNFMGVKDETYGLFVHSETRKQLIKDIKTYLKFMYETYIINDTNDKLTERAKQFKKLYLKNTYEIQGDS